MHCPRLGAQFQTQRYSIPKKRCCIHCKVDHFFKRVSWSQKIVFDTSCLTVLITIGAKTTHVMVINSSEEPKSKFTLFHSVKKEDILQQNNWKLISFIVTSKCTADQVKEKI